MPQLSSKADLMPASPIRKLVPYADKAKQRGTKVYHLNIGQPDIVSPEAALDAYRNLPFDVIAYTHSEGTPEYRKALSDYYKGRGYDVAPNNIIVTNGGSEALLFTFGVIANPDDEIIIPEPYYANYNSFACQSEVKIVPIKSSIESNFALPPIESFEEKITDKTRAILICHPGNPTGYLYSQEELNKLKDLVLKHDLYLISDEVYAEYIYGEEEHHSVLGFDELKNNVIVIDSESKRFSMCGARLGAMISRNEEMMSKAMKFAQARLSPVLTSQYAATKAHENVGSYFEDSRAEYVSRRDILISELNKIPGVVCPNPKGAFYCMVELPVDDAEKFAIWLLNDFDLNGETIMVAPGNGFYSNPESGKKQVRIAYVLKKEDLIRSVEILKVALEQYYAKTLI
ncbi:pyridoxal phosphate-dependent aminotransferase [Moheibacter sediminis]|uniref:Aspartate aminotransferase n=1 Tax=Moheibacter sediminis TaxID=1434700 RepID=A0A1W2AEG6_9FLAO|nr:pyridoxal phosphate-dependent aminotransferase [Moheibacter sediminis]SMC58851.1 aspartate aminotransferase [Moheibacter sediminis]